MNDTRLERAKMARNVYLYKNDLDLDDNQLGFAVKFATAEVALAKSKCEWVPCSERLPETSDWYLVAVNDEVNDDGIRVHIDFFNQCFDEWDANPAVKKPIAWMPLPKYGGEIVEVEK